MALFELQASNNTITLPQQNPGSPEVDTVYPLNLVTGKLLCFRYGNKLLGYKYNREDYSWSLKWEDPLSTRTEVSYNSSLYPIKVTNIIDKESKDVLIVRTQHGIQFYGADADISTVQAVPGSELKLLATDTRFADIYKWNEPSHTFLWGRFYPNQNLMGLLTRNNNGQVNFYSVRKDKVLSGEPYPMGASLAESVSLNPIWSSPSTKIIILDIASSGPEIIGLRTPQGLQIFRFNSKYQIEQVQEVNPIFLISPDGLLLSANLTPSRSFRNIVECSLNGIYIHTFDIDTKSYQPEFISSISHTDQCKSIRFLDINQDGRMVMFFTGSQTEGLKGICFNISKSTWDSILSKEILKGRGQDPSFINIIGSISSPPTFFSCDFDDTTSQIQMRVWNVIKKRQPTTMLPTRIPNITHNSSGVKDITTDRSTTTTTSEGPRLFPEIIDPVKLPTTKRILRWTEQWDNTFLKDSLELTSGILELNIPLLNTITPKGLGIQLFLKYNSRNAVAIDKSDLLGTGWNIQLTNDCITVHYQNSIFAQDAIYTLKTAGRSQVLKRSSETSETITFEIPNEPKVQCTYYFKRGGIRTSSNIEEEWWVIESPTELMIYGKSPTSIQQSLSSSFWKGPGSISWETLEHEPVAWFLTEHYSKARNASIFYFYEIDKNLALGGNQYVSDLRLVKIADEQNTNITFGYKLKESSEYNDSLSKSSSTSNTNSAGNVQLDMNKKHFLESVEFQSPQYTQLFQFQYTVKNRERLLTQMNQLIYEKSETLLKFNYGKNSEKVTLLTSVILPSGFTLSYTYKQTPFISCPPIYPPTQRYPVPDTYKIESSTDYMVLAWKDDEGMMINNKKSSQAKYIILKVLSQVAMQTILETQTSKEIVKNEEINSFKMNAYDNHIVLVLITQTKKILCIFTRDKNKIWEPIPKCYKYSKDTLIHSSPSYLVTAAINSAKLAILELLPEPETTNQGWKKISIQLSQPLQQIVIDPKNENRIYTYDDRTVCLVSRAQTKDGSWNVQTLYSGSIISGFMALNKLTIHSFDHSSEVTEILLDDLRQDLLQIVNNVIVLSTLQVKSNSNSLFIQIIVFHLNKNFQVQNIIKKDVQKEDLLKLKYDLEYDGSTYTLMYETNRHGPYTVKVKSVSGKIAEEVNKIGNKNLRSDAMEQLIKDINNHENWSTSVKDVVLFNWNAQYRTQLSLSPNGVHMGTSGVLLRMTGTEWVLEMDEKIQEQQIQLGEYFTLEQKTTKNKSDINSEKILYKLYKHPMPKSNRSLNTAKTIEEIEASPPSYLVNRFPLYLAWQSGSHVIVLPFLTQDTIGTKQYFDQETILHQSSFQSLISIANANAASNFNHVFPKEIISRPTWSLVSISKKMEALVQKVDLIAHGMTRQTLYERSFKFHQNNEQVDNICTESVEIIPGGNKNISGWRSISMEHHYMGNGNNKTVTMSDNWLDADNQIVQKPYEKSEEEKQPTEESSSIKKDQKDEDEDDTKMLKDKSGQLIISNFSPYSTKDEEVGFIGFESYENILPWRLNESNIVRNEFAFTGSSFLRLDSRSRSRNVENLEGVFEPKDQDSVYIVSTWLRLTSVKNKMEIVNNSLNTSVPVPYFKAVISTVSTKEEIVGLQGVIKRQEGDWNYVEIIIDYKMIKQLYQQKYLNVNSTKKFVDFEKFSIKIFGGLYQSDDVSLDIDHVRFSPYDHDFQATVYDIESGTGKPRPTATIKSNGEVNTIIYNRFDDKNKELIRIKSNGMLGPFVCENKAGNLFPPPQIKIQSDDADADATRFPSKPQLLPSTLTFVPDTGFYETFDSFAFKHRWNIVSSIRQEKERPLPWKASPGRLWHDSLGLDRIQAIPSLFHPRSASLRCVLELQRNGASIHMIWKSFLLIFQRLPNGLATLLMQTVEKETPMKTLFEISLLSPTGEFIISVETSIVFLWINGILLVEQELPLNSESNPWSTFAFEARGNILIEDCLFMNLPKITVGFFNSFGDASQVINLEGRNSAFVSETLYDILGRGGIQTKETRILRSSTPTTKKQPLLAHYSSFALNVNPLDESSVWETGLLQGDVNRLNPNDEGYPYFRTIYLPNPLNEEGIIGLPGKDFSTNGRYAKKHSDDSGIDFLSNYFPSSSGFRQKTERFSNGKISVDVFNDQKSKVATYVHSPGYDHILSTFEYDKENRLVKILPPCYHAKARTLSKSEAWQSNTNHLSSQEIIWQEAMGTHFKYNSDGLMTSKTTPDSGKVTFVYNSLKQIESMIFEELCSTSGNEMNKSNVTRTVTNFFKYDSTGQLSRTGYLQTHFNVNPNMAMQSIPSEIDHQLIEYSNDNANRNRNGKFKEIITYNEGEYGNVPLVEKLQFNSDGHLESKQTLITFPGIIDSKTEFLSKIKKEFRGGRMYSIQYPDNFKVDGKPFKLIHHYNRQGQLVSLRSLLSPQQPSIYFLFTYEANGLPSEEIYSPNSVHNFTRSFTYNSPGFLETIEDPFLKQALSYTKEGYGQEGFGDGSVMKSMFFPKWVTNVDWRYMTFGENTTSTSTSTSTSNVKFHLPQICINALQRLGFLSSSGRPLKEFNYSLSKIDLPLQCGGRTAQQIAQMLSSNQIPQEYGHRYTYGNHGELVKVKFFAQKSQSNLQPIQPHSFMSINGINIRSSEDIWKKLKEARYIVTNTRNFETGDSTGNRGKSFYGSGRLSSILKKLNPKYFIYEDVVKTFLSLKFIQKKSFTAEEFYNTFLVWDGLVDSVLSTNPLEMQWRKSVAKDILTTLTVNGYTNSSLHTHNKEAIYTANMKSDSTIKSALHMYADILPEILGVLQDHFTQEIGTHPFDLESYEIDPNGNHKKFFAGFHRFEFSYKNNTNQINSAKLISPDENDFEKIYEFEHDHRGNVICSMLQGIKRITYNHSSQRTTRIDLVDGRHLNFFYDSQGERILKQVFTPEGFLSKEIFYVRDEKGRVLIDTETIFVGGDEPLRLRTIETLYLYGPRGLLGFIRNNRFHNVITDHTGSTRLVTRDGKVLVAYDYLPYGLHMRTYVASEEGHIRYRFTSQEWDEETGLYNFHARLYDPRIGRFYQIDPKAQYYSPYKYAGNSPISLVDPDGEFAWFIAAIIGLAIGGGYLGGAAANRRWNPKDWDFKDHGTYLGMFGGAVAGAVLPIGFGASVAAIGSSGTIGLGTVGTYITRAGKSLDFKSLVKTKSLDFARVGMS